MNTTSKHGGPAFPVAFRMNDKQVILEDGISVRDYFAAQAILREFPDHWSINDMAENAYLIADAMLDERAKP